MRSQLTPERRSNGFKYSSGQGSNLYNSEYRTGEYIDKLFSECTQLKNKLEDTELSNSKITLENKNLIDRLKSSENQIQNLKFELDKTSSTIKGITTENRCTIEDFYNLKQTCISIESKNVILQNEINRIRTELQKVIQQKTILENQLSSTNKEIRDEDRKTILEYQDKLQYLDNELKQNQDKLRLTIKENQSFSETIREKNEEIRARDINRKSLEKEIRELRGVVEKYENAQDEIKKLKDMIEDFSIEVKITKQENEDIKSAIKYKDEDIRQYRNYLEQANKDMESAKKCYEDERAKIDSYSISLRNMSFLEDQNQQMKLQIENFQSHERQILEENDQLRLLLQKSEEKLSLVLRQIESIQNQKLILEAENAKFQKNFSEILSQNNNKNMELTKSETKLQQLSLEIDDLHVKLRKSNDEIYSVKKELKNCQGAFEAEKMFGLRQNDQIVQLKDYINELESYKNEAMDKIENYKINDYDKDMIIRKMHEEMNSLRKQLGVNEKIFGEGVLEKDNVIKVLENTRFELSRRNDEILNLKGSLKICMVEIEEYKKRTGELQESEGNLKRMWRDAEIERSRLEEINRAMKFR
ncbi:hypothetical protein SteCoe_7124 [Stentor coeruleus]|uniref:Uncharacterized protein n=1 Tax=Stentor coeruleus TaxID=5963 RepID=A0A1R2CND2_9CILI|nr:hypothetical protein SteCoe_7124 [Stentor coeruleus]